MHQFEFNAIDPFVTVPHIPIEFGLQDTGGGQLIASTWNKIKSSILLNYIYLLLEVFFLKNYNICIFIYLKLIQMDNNLIITSLAFLKFFGLWFSRKFPSVNILHN